MKTRRMPIVAVGLALLGSFTHACTSDDDGSIDIEERLVFIIADSGIENRQLVYWDITEESKEPLAEGVTGRLPTALADSSELPISFRTNLAEQDLKIWTTADDRFAELGPGSGGAAGPNGAIAYCADSGRLVSARSGSADEAVVVHDWQRQRGCADMSWSRDGRLAFVDVDPGDTSEEPPLALFVFDFEHGTTITPLRDYVGGAGAISWSADGTSIAVSIGSGSALFDGSTGEVLATFDAELALFSPNDTSTVLTLTRTQGVAELAVVRSGTPVASLELRDPDAGLAWSPTGDAIAIVDLFGLHRWNWEPDEFATLYAADLPDEILAPSVLWLNERD